MQVFIIINNVGIMINADVNVKNWLTNAYVMKDLSRTRVIVKVNVINHKSYDVGEYLDYENCKCRKSSIDNLVEECSENIDGNAMTNVTLNEYKNACGFSAIYIVLLAAYFLFLLVLKIN